MPEITYEQAIAMGGNPLENKQRKREEGEISIKVVNDFARYFVAPEHLLPEKDEKGDQIAQR